MMENNSEKIYVNQYVTDFDIDCINVPIDKFIENVKNYKQYLITHFPNFKNFTINMDYDELKIYGDRLETDIEYKFRVNKESSERDKKMRQYLKLQKELGLDQ